MQPKHFGVFFKCHLIVWLQLDFEYKYLTDNLQQYPSKYAVMCSVKGAVICYSKRKVQALSPTSPTIGNYTNVRVDTELAKLETYQI